ncbi:MAG: hypothetical protein L6Q92_04630 [Phycisphaerae bacterium]|nr:hypothetical protein [Phycisphaerae bacterium]
MEHVAAVAGVGAGVVLGSPGSVDVSPAPPPNQLSTKRAMSFSSGWMHSEPSNW